MIKILYLVLIPLFIWMLIGSYKQLRRRLNIENDWDELIFPVIWMGMILFIILAMARELLL